MWKNTPIKRCRLSPAATGDGRAISGQVSGNWFVWFVWFIWFVSFILFVQPDQQDKPNEPNKPDG
jgi:hypothetical protein